MSRPSFYVAAASVEVARAEAVRDALIARGFRCAFDWCLSMRAHAAFDGESLTVGGARLASQSDMGAVQTADFFALLVPDPRVATTGAWVELGACLGGGGVAYVVASDVAYLRCVFLALPEIVRVDTDAALVDLLCRDATAEGYEVRL